MEYACCQTARLAASNALQNCKDNWSLAEEVEKSRFNSAHVWPCIRIVLQTRSGMPLYASVAVVYKDGNLFVRLWIMDNVGVFNNNVTQHSK